MNKSALIKHEIYTELSSLNLHDLSMVADFIDFMKHRKKPKIKKVVKLQGILKGYDIDLSDLKKIRENEWRHLEEEFQDE